MILVLVLVVLWVVVGRRIERIDARWGAGAKGEFRVGKELERLHKEGFHVFHDWYSSKGNVEHFVVGPQGVFAVETKAWWCEISAKNGWLLKHGHVNPYGRFELDMSKRLPLSDNTHTM